jgi:membrane protein
MSAPDPPAREEEDDRPVVRRLVAGVASTVTRLRRNWSWFDHLARAGGRYTRMQSDLMAAGITYFAFLSIFPVMLLAASIIGLVLAGNEALQQELVAAIREAVPGQTGEFLVEQLQDAISASGVSGAIGLVVFLYAGLRTMDKLRIGVRRVWTGRPIEPDFLRDNLRDVVAFLALGLSVVVSVALTGGVTTATSWVLGVVGLDELPGFFLLTTVVGISLALAADTVIFLWLLKVVAHTGVGLRHLLPGALFGAVGFEILKVLGSFYLALISGSVTASTFGGAVGILVWINLVARYALFTTAWTANLPAVRAELASGPPAEPSEPPASPRRDS